MTPMRTVSACAWARVQSRLSAAVAAAELLSSVRREIGIGSSHRCNLVLRGSIRRIPGKVNTARRPTLLAKGLGETGFLFRHDRACPGPRLPFGRRQKTWLPGTSSAKTRFALLPGNDGGESGSGLAQRAAQLLRHVEQRRVLLYHPLGAVEAAHGGGGHAAARGEGDEAVEDRLVVLAEQALVIVGADAEVKRAIAARSVVIDDVAHQDQAGAVF